MRGKRNGIGKRTGTGKENFKNRMENTISRIKFFFYFKISNYGIIRSIFGKAGITPRIPEFPEKFGNVGKPAKKITDIRFGPKLNQIGTKWDKNMPLLD